MELLRRGITRLIPISLQRTITGTVTDAQTGEGLPGVSVVLKGTNIGTATDVNGHYELDYSRTALENVLVFTFLGYVSQEEQTGSRQTINVQLKKDITGLEEVVVIGYGTQRKVNLTGSVSTVSGEDLARRPVGQTTAALQGMVPGLTVTQRSGQPGKDGGNVRIRGIGTTGDSNPLVILDGVESSLNNVDPNEIESITVLKDAASAAIYGARAANGVILITTKRASAKGFSVNYNTYGGWQTPTDMPDIVGALDHMEMMNEAYTNTGRAPLYSAEYIEEYKSQGPSNRDRYPNTDWQDLTLKDNAFMQSHYLAVNAGNEKIRVLGSLSYLDQEGIIPNTGFKRYNLRLNSDIKFSDKFTTALDVFLRRTDLEEPTVGTGYVFHWMRRIPANQAGILSNGLYGEGWNGDHPLARARDGGMRNQQILSAILNMNVKFKPVQWLTAEVNYAPKFNEPHTTAFSNIIQTYRWDFSPSYAIPGRNSLTEEFSRDWYNNLRASVTYDNLLADKHQVTVLAGFQREDQSSNFIRAYREVFQLPEYQEINSGNEENQQTAGSGSHWALQSFYGRINYNYKEKYLFEANGRYDGSSRFATGNKYAFFPSVSAGWRISQEPFMSGIGHVVTDLKLRASWGRLGNQNIGLYPFAAFVDIGNSNYVFGEQVTTGAALNDMANPTIRWEETEVSDIGLDLNLWSKFTLTADYYYRKTSGILLRLDIPTMIGLTAPFQNAGVVENRGWELSMNYRDRLGSFDYGVSFNLSDVRNKVLDLKGIRRTGRQVSWEGHPIDAFYGYQAIGFFQDAADVENSPEQFGNVAAGDLKYRDLNNDGVINTEDQAIIGSNIPRYTYSANIDLGYKGIDLSVFLQGVGKVDGFLYGQGIMPFFTGGTVQEQHKDRWTPENRDAAFPRFAFNENNNEQNSDFWMKSAAYLRLKNIQLGYTFPASLLKGKVERLRIYVSGQNLFTVEDFWQGYDVEAPASDGAWYPQMKTYSLGLDVKF
ncbi:SusC/RagA family TonB-linked outer membrane protein [Anseongella ginsenosidimutans]|uniref:SusC/RagA family TonB-linked outer membrane protein n=1 Tax=Anseongella ginsenosidimutans TaxID=496056 RepID=UPI0011CC7DE5|nr:TonB-dependent receptor [Anseongella ginsenosidimutans]QEC52499.1 TonB-dependent receptor [Anseongella ginsenosidimutans]